MDLDTTFAKPRLRGVLHQYAFFVAVVLGALLVVDASVSAGGTTAVRVTAAAVYAIGICGLFGVSALYHRGTWSPRARRWMRRADHAMIFVFIAASYTPVAVLVLDGTISTVVLAGVWGGAACGVALKLFYIDAPRWLSAMLYVALGWVAVATLPDLWERLGLLSVAAFGVGGLLYTVGAVVWARGRPDPWPQTFGFHEIFHSCVIAAAAVHYAVIAFAIV
jgi:hemolysin III